MNTPPQNLTPAGLMAAEPNERLQQSTTEPKISDSDAVVSTSVSPEEIPDYLYGWQLHCTTFG